MRDYCGSYLASSSYRAGGAATSVVRVLSFVVFRLAGSGIDAGPNIAPCAVVQRFLLHVE